MTGPVAHAGAPIAPHDLPTAWNVDPVLIVLLIGGTWLYGRGAARLRRGPAGRRALPRWRVGCFAGAVASTAVALVSPLDALSEALFGAHMFQHLLLTLLVPPLLVLGRPLLVSSMALSGGAHRVATVARIAVRPPRRTSWWWAAFAVVVHSITMWMWHLPGLYETALADRPVHIVEHVTLLAGALPFWWLVVDARGRHANAAGVLAVFGGVLQSGALAGLITFSGAAWYPTHAVAAASWGLTGLEDQHIAGGLMWFPGGLAYVLGGSLLFLRWLAADERRVLIDVFRERGAGA